MVRKSYNNSRRQLTDAQIRQMIPVLRDALHEANLTLKNAGAAQPVHPPMTTRHAHPHHAYDGADSQHAHVHEHQNDANHAPSSAHSHAELGEAAGTQGQYGKHVRLTREGAQVLNSAFQRAEDGLEGALPPEWRALYRDIQRYGSIG